MSTICFSVKMGQNLPISVLGLNSQPLRYDLLLARSGMLRLKREREREREREGGKTREVVIVT